jgi:hypothetical protein
MDDLWVALSAAAETGRRAADAGDWATAREAARVVLSAGSKLHAKLGILVDLRDDAAWKAAVDRTLAKERRQRLGDGPQPIPGDQQLPTGDVSSSRTEPGASPRKGPRRGKGG